MGFKLVCLQFGEEGNLNKNKPKTTKSTTIDLYNFSVYFNYSHCMPLICIANVQYNMQFQIEKEISGGKDKATVLNRYKR